MAVNETPPFWFAKPGLKAFALWPLSFIYSRAARARMFSKPTAALNVPVLCIGNFVVGGGGKTPTAIAFAQAIKKKGYKPGILSRGYGGKVAKQTIVDASIHNALDVGDEPLLLAKHAITVVSADRVVGAKMLIEEGCDFIIMDDGFQNPSLTKDFNLVVVDSRRGIGNGFSLPAGPLRVGIKHQMSMANAVLIVGEDDGADKVIRLTAKSGRPIYHAKLAMQKPSQLRKQNLLPYAGIADPKKFFDSLIKAGAILAQVKPFGDHHYFHKDDITELLETAKKLDAQLVTTEKDQMRLIGMGQHQEALAEASQIVEVKLQFEDKNSIGIIIDKVLSNFYKRHLAQLKEIEKINAEEAAANDKATEVKK
ncbi:MAG: tetraacyldisaccharide 4'-kinase [Nitratireductor sp.]